MAPLRFLIVEDHEFQRAVLEQALRGLGAEAVYCASNGAEALHVLRDPASRIHIVVSDLMMPDVDGIEMLPRLHEAAAGVSLVLASSAAAVVPAAAEIARAQGIDVLGTIVKPVTPAKLRPLLERYLAQHPELRTDPS